MQQVGCDKEKATKALKEANGDVSNGREPRHAWRAKQREADEISSVWFALVLPANSSSTPSWLRRSRHTRSCVEKQAIPIYEAYVYHVK